MTKKQIKKALIDADMSQKDLAREIGVTHIYVNMLLAGRRPINDRISAKIKQALKK
jgi:transcriptional regulator with XRE-family HTH domain